MYDQGNLLSSPSWVWVIVLVCTASPQQMQGNMSTENWAKLHYATLAVD